MGNLIVLAILVVIVIFAIRHIIRTKKSGGCGCGCSGCAQKSNCISIKDKDK